MNPARLLVFSILGAVVVSAVAAQPAEPRLPRPGAIVATEVIGEVTVTAGDETKPVKPDERVRVGVTITTGRRSLVALELSNGATLRLGSEAELELDEFGQQPFPSSVKVNEIKEEPTISRTRLKLVRGDLAGEIKKLNTTRGSSFTLELQAGTLRVSEGSFHARVRMTEIGLGVCTIDLRTGAAEFEPVGGAPAPVPAGKRLGFAVETDRINGTVKLSPLPSVNEAPARQPAAAPTPAPKVDPPAEASKTSAPSGKG